MGYFEFDNLGTVGGNDEEFLFLSPWTALTYRTVRVTFKFELFGAVCTRR